LDSCILMSDETFNLLQYFVFVAAYLENPTSHLQAYITGNRRSLSTANLDIAGYSWGDCTRIQSVEPAQFFFSEISEIVSNKL